MIPSGISRENVILTDKSETNPWRSFRLVVVVQCRTDSSSLPSLLYVLFPRCDSKYSPSGTYSIDTFPAVYITGCHRRVKTMIKDYRPTAVRWQLDGSYVILESVNEMVIIIVNTRSIYFMRF